MEYALEEDTQNVSVRMDSLVLILVLLEYALEVFNPATWTPVGGLNPCFNGICSRSYCGYGVIDSFNSLNPCFNGICSRSTWQLQVVHSLIRLNPCFNGICSRRENHHRQENWRSLNPCFNGICSRSHMKNFFG